MLYDGTCDVHAGRAEGADSQRQSGERNDDDSAGLQLVLPTRGQHAADMVPVRCRRHQVRPAAACLLSQAL
jgi:hypothetical protein